jgi:diguanylate cyclase (GGDEF)-like protein/PAS domain S-box-containing protein
MREPSRLSSADAMLHEAESRFTLVFESSSTGMALLSLGGRAIRVNEALCRLLGYERSELLRCSFTDVLHPDEHALAREETARLVAGEIDEFRSERRFLHAQGGIVFAEERVGLLRSAAGEPVHLVAQIEDVSERREMEFRLQELAERDPLTGLPNRPLFEQELARQVAVCRRVREPAALLLLDLDHFKYVNDAHGHRVGDQLLRLLAATVRRTLPPSAIIGRLGGDELGILLAGVDRAGALAVGEQLGQAIREGRHLVAGEELHATASIGVAVMEPDAADAEAVLVSADLAVYEAKGSGGDRTVVHDPRAGGRERVSSDLRWAQRIRAALEHDRLVLHAQPIVDAETRVPVIFELLLRMCGDDGELIAPGMFLSHAERFGLIGAVDRWVVSHAVELVGEHDLCLSINLSGRSIGDPTLPAFIEGRVRETGIDPRRLLFEVTETAAIANMGDAQHLAERLGAIGCKFALDDFGAGFASFTYVKQIPFDFLKIDGSFVRDLETSAADRLVVRALVEVARGLGKATVAEYVHDAAVLAEARRCGIDLAQGFHLGAPAPLESWL